MPYLSSKNPCDWGIGVWFLLSDNVPLCYGKCPVYWFTFKHDNIPWLCDIKLPLLGIHLGFMVYIISKNWMCLCPLGPRMRWIVGPYPVAWIHNLDQARLQFFRCHFFSFVSWKHGFMTSDVFSGRQLINYQRDVLLHPLNCRYPP